MLTTPLDPRIEGLSIEQMELFLQFYYEEDRIKQEFIEDVLGTMWDPEMFNQLKGGEADGEEVETTSGKLRIPLAIAIRPEIVKELRTRFGLSTPEEEWKDPLGGEAAPGVPKNAQSLFNLPKEQFINKLMGGEQSTSNLPKKERSPHSKPYQKLPNPRTLKRR